MLAIAKGLRVRRCSQLWGKLMHIKLSELSNQNYNH